MTRFGALEELRSRPIGALAAARIARKNFRTAVPIRRDNALYGEALVDAREQGLAGVNFYFSDRNPPYWQRIEGATDKLLLRASVAEKLQQVNRRVAGAGLELFVFDAWRPRAVQAYFHDVWMPEQLQKRHLHLSGDALWREVERYWSAPTTNLSAPAPHSTGGAVDLTLRWKDGEQLWMGSLFDDATAIAHRDHFERH